MNLKIIFEDLDILVVDKPAGIVVFPEGQTTEKTLIDLLIEQNSDLKNVGEAPRYGIVHRLDKDTSGVILVAKSSEALIFLQKQFKNREVDKIYIALVTGAVKEENGTTHTLIGRAKSDPRKQAAHSLEYTGKKDLREAITEYKVIQRFADYTLLEVQIKTGRKHQIRCHLAYIHHPIAGDKMYGFKDSPAPKGLERQFLHASYLKIMLPSGEVKEFESELPSELKKVLEDLSTK
ncbi:MAG: RluA family pseudouridine synthase [Candidatus Staskawiczbacteria bacterium]|nr:RluA family pseudouridine synthase [Candidatus Staskawiczbacteria bacterium]